MELQNKIVGVMGRKGSGKSVMARQLLRGLERVFVCDMMFEHTWVPAKNVCSSLDRVDEFFDWADSQRFYCGSYVPQDKLKAECEELCEIVYGVGNMTFGLEEVASLCGPNYLPPAGNVETSYQ
jgi:ABC-type multidrug transport system ATPase subunit